MAGDLALVGDCVAMSVARQATRAHPLLNASLKRSHAGASVARRMHSIMLGSATQRLHHFGAVPATVAWCSYVHGSWVMTWGT